MTRNQIIEQLPALRRYARVLAGDAWSADDLVQDTLERACVKWNLWAAGSDLRAWLFTLMHNLYLNQRRGDHLSAVSVNVEDVQADLVAPAGRPDDALDLMRCLLRLPAEQRAVLLLVTVEDMSYEQTARVLGIPAGTVMSRLSRARNRLRELMEGMDAKPAAVAVNTDMAAPAPVALRRLK